LQFSQKLSNIHAIVSRSCVACISFNDESNDDSWNRASLTGYGAHDCDDDSQSFFSDDWDGYRLRIYSSDDESMSDLSPRSPNEHFAIAASRNWPLGMQFFHQICLKLTSLERVSYSQSDDEDKPQSIQYGKSIAHHLLSSKREFLSLLT
jgi:hypothetical protein